MHKILCYQAIFYCVKYYAMMRLDFGGSVCWCECVAFIVFMCSVRSLWVCIVGVVWCLTALNSCHHCEQWWRCLHVCTVWWWYYADVSGSPILSNMIPLMSSIVIRESGRNSIWPDSCIWIWTLIDNGCDVILHHCRTLLNKSCTYLRLNHPWKIRKYRSPSEWMNPAEIIFCWILLYVGIISGTMTLNKLEYESW